MANEIMAIDVNSLDVKFGPEAVGGSSLFSISPSLVQEFESWSERSLSLNSLPVIYMPEESEEPDKYAG